MKKKLEVKREEQGFPGHYMMAGDCLFRRNTLISYGKRKIVVSSVGRQWDNINHRWFPVDAIVGAYYETAVFKAKRFSDKWIADVDHQIHPKGNTYIASVGTKEDRQANKMHEKIVEEMIAYIRSNR